MKKLAIVGSGLFGLAAAEALLGAFEITCYSQEAPSASEAALGLLHPFVGKEAKLNDKGREALAASLDLLEKASSYVEVPFHRETGLLRIAINETQAQAFQKSAELHPEIELYSKQKCETWITGEAPHGGCFIHSAHSVDTPTYLVALKKFLIKKGCRFVHQQIENLAELDSYDQVLLATGASTAQLFPSLKLQIIKGQLLTFSWDEQLSHPPFPIMKKKTLAVSDSLSAWAGATYERDFESATPDKETAVNEIIPEILALYPEWKVPKKIQVRAGLRAFTSDRRPLVKRIHERLVIATGLGSKGLLYHAFYARNLLSLFEG